MIINACLLKSKDAMRAGFTLLEVLVAVTIIALLASILLPVIAMVTYQSEVSIAANTIRALDASLRSYQTKTGFNIYPDNADKSDTTKNLTGFFRYDKEDPKSGLINILGRTETFSPATETFDDDGLLLDPWGEPYYFVRGDFTNKKRVKATYDDTKPQDSNKPKDADLPPLDSDWNIDDDGGYFYIYSHGDSNSEDDWVYVKNLRDNEYE